MRHQLKDEKGRFKRKHHMWTPLNMDDGYVDSAGRFRVYLPTHKRAYATGYILRAIVHYEYFNDCIIEEGFDVHHKNGDRLDDSNENLEKIDHSKHSIFHNPIRIKYAKRTCLTCHTTFLIKVHRLKEKTRGRYCSPECFWGRGVSKETRDKMSKSKTINKWSKRYDNCICCGKSNYSYAGKGLCRYCYQVKYEKNRGDKN